MLPLFTGSVPLLDPIRASLYPHIVARIDNEKARTISYAGQEPFSKHVFLGTQPPPASPIFFKLLYRHPTTSNLCYNSCMKASDKMKLNGYAAAGCVLRNGEAYILSPWAFPSEEEYAALVQSMQPDYVFSATEAGVVAVPNVE